MQLWQATRGVVRWIGLWLFSQARRLVNATQPPPERVPDEEMRRRLRLVAVCAAAAVFFSSFFALHYYRAEGEIGPATGALILGVLFMSGVLCALPFARSNRTLGTLVPFVMLAVVGAVAYFDTGLTSAVPLFWHALMPLVAALLVGPGVAFALVALIAAEAVGLYLLVPHGPATPSVFAGPAEEAWVAMLSAIASSVFAAAVGCAYEFMRRRAFQTRDHALSRLQRLHAELRAAHGRLVRHDAVLGEAQRISGIGAWHYNIKTGTTFWSAEHRRLHGYPPGAPAPSRKAFLEMVHAEDRAALAASMDRASESREPTTATYRVERADGAVRTMRSTAKVVQISGEGAAFWMVGTTQDVTAERRHEADLVKARQDAEASARLKDAILTNLSHEMRTPVSSICGFAEILAEEAAEEAHREFADLIHRSGVRLGATLNALLDLASLEAKTDPQATGAARETDAAAVVEEAVAAAQPDAVRKGLALTLSTLRDAPGDGASDSGETPEGEAARVWLGGDGLRRIAGHLVANAIKFTERGRVEVRLALGTRALRLRVADTGRGISDDFLPRLYEPFQQESDGLSRTHGGAGLGLTIVHRLVERMGGAISVESRPAEGTTFAVVLPYAPPPDEVENAAGDGAEAAFTFAPPPAR